MTEHRRARLSENHVGRALRKNLAGHEVKTVSEAGWAGVKNSGVQPRSEPDSGNPTVRDRRGLVETWTMGMAIRSHTAETPKQPSCCLRLLALHFYSDRHSWHYTQINYCAASKTQ